MFFRSHWVNSDELDDVVDAIRQEVRDAAEEVTRFSEESTRRLQKEVRDLREHLAQEAILAEDTRTSAHEAKAVAKSSVRRLNEEVAELRSSLCRQLESDRRALEEQGVLRAAEHEALDSRLSAELRRLSAETAAGLAVLRSQLGALLQQQELSAQASVGAVRREAEAQIAAASSASAAELARAQAQWEESDARRTSAERQVRCEIGHAMRLLDERVEKATQEYRDMSQSSTSELGERLALGLMKHERRLGCLEDRADDLSVSVSRVANIPTRRIEWRLRNISQWASSRDSTAEPFASWVSPPFSAAGVDGLQLELQHTPASGDGQAAAPGDCTLTLRAEHGLMLVFSLYVGDSQAVQMEHRFEDGERCACQPLCFLADQVSQDEDSLLVGIEILEAGIEVRSPCGSDAVPSGGERSAEGSDSGALEASMVAQRYLNHRVLDLVKGQVDVMTSRMVRQVEWRIESASTMRRCFPEGHSICSSTFDAAGIQGLQFVFYPQGLAGAKEGFCSLFLHCPSGTHLKCWLSAGKTRREVRMSSEHQGFLGRTNFCRFDGCVDPADDSVLLVLEVGEAQHNSEDRLSHEVSLLSESQRQTPFSICEPPRRGGIRPPPSPRPVHVQPPTATPGNKTPEDLEQAARPTPESAGPTRRAATIDSIVRLTRNPGKNLLEDVRQLPSIWTSKTPGDIASALESFHTFGAAKQARQPMSQPQSGCGLACQDACLVAGIGRGDRPEQRGRSASCNPRRYSMYMSS